MGLGVVFRYSLFAIRHSNSLARRALTWLVLVPGAAAAGVPSDIVLQAEARRVEMIERAVPSVVCVFDSLQRAGGSGVLIDPQGYGLTNYHVVAGLLGSRKGLGGLADGVLYELEVLGIDVTGDVAMFRLIGPKPDFVFPHARLGDSDAVQMGDTAIAMGNPFSLSQDYRPTVSLGMVTGVHRYQQGVRGNLVYTDCIQVDAPINPGNSGGPLFNEAGKVIGINGRISVNTRGRFNVGFAYAISSNQIKRFIPALRAGLLARHGTWQAIVEDLDGVGVVFSRVGKSGPAYQAGVRVGDRLLSLDGVGITSANQVMSMLGTYPANWPVLLQIRREAAPREVIVRLDAVKPKMRNPFAVDEDVNLRQVRRVLGAFRRAVLGGDAGKRLGSWKWTVARHYHAGADGSARSPERFEASQTGDGPIRMQQRYADGSLGRSIEYDDRVATERVTEDEEPYELPADVSVVLAALYTMQRSLLEPDPEIELIDVAHVGADALVKRSANPLPLGVQLDPRDKAEPQLLEVISWPQTNGAVARFAFDSESFAVIRIRVHEPVSGAKATIELSDHKDIGGLVWPCTIKVKGDGYAYCDTLSDWELLP